MPLRNVSDHTGDQQPVFCLQWTEADFNRELTAVFALRPKLIAGAHRSGHRGRKVASTMLEMTLPKSFRKQCLDQLSQKLLAAIAKQLLCLLIDQNDFAFSIDDHNPVRSRLQKPAKLRLSSFCLGAANLLVVQMRASSFDRGFACADEVILPVSFVLTRMTWTLLLSLLQVVLLHFVPQRIPADLEEFGGNGLVAVGIL